MQIQTFWKGFEAFECKFELLERDLMHSNPNSNQDRKVLNANSKHSKGILSIRMQLKPFERDSKHSNPNSNHLKGIQKIWKQT